MARPGQRFDLLGSGSALGAPLEGGIAVLVIEVDAEVFRLGALHLNSPSQLVLRPVFGPGNLNQIYIINKIVSFVFGRQNALSFMQKMACLYAVLRLSTTRLVYSNNIGLVCTCLDESSISLVSVVEGQIVDSFAVASQAELGDEGSVGQDLGVRGNVAHHRSLGALTRQT